MLLIALLKLAVRQYRAECREFWPLITGHMSAVPFIFFVMELQTICSACIALSKTGSFERLFAAHYRKYANMLATCTGPTNAGCLQRKQVGSTGCMTCLCRHRRRKT